MYAAYAVYVSLALCPLTAMQGSMQIATHRFAGSIQDFWGEAS